MNSTYQGHHADGSGVQKHSAGSHYPLVVAVYGSKFAAVEGPRGEFVKFKIYDDTPGHRMAAYSEALQYAEFLAKRYQS